MSTCSSTKLIDSFAFIQICIVGCIVIELSILLAFFSLDDVMKTVFSVISPLNYSLICTHSVFVSSNKAAFFSAKNYDALEKKMIFCLYFLRRSLCVSPGLNRCVSEEHECILFHLQSTRKPKQQPLLHLIIWMIPLGKGNNAMHHTKKVSSFRGVYVRKREKSGLAFFLSRWKIELK